MEASELLRQSIQRAHFARATPAVERAPPRPAVVKLSPVQEKPVEAPLPVQITIPVNDLEDRVAKLEVQLKAVINRSRRIYGPTVEDGGSRYLGMNEIRRIVGKRFGVSVHQLNRPSRDERTIYVRHIAFYLCKTHTLRSLPAIGRMFARDHTTVMHGVRKIGHHRLISEELNHDLTELEAELALELEKRAALAK